jgi:hypothetical protein
VTAVLRIVVSVAGWLPSAGRSAHTLRPDPGAPTCTLRRMCGRRATGSAKMPWRGEVRYPDDATFVEVQIWDAQEPLSKEAVDAIEAVIGPFEVFVVEA